MNHITPIRERTGAEAALISAYLDLRDRLPGSGTPWVTDARESAFAAFQEKGLPNRRDEAWRYTDLRVLLGEVPSFGVAGAGKTAPSDLSDGLSRIRQASGVGDAHELVFENGLFRADLSSHEALAGVCDVVALKPALEAGPDWVKQAFSIEPEAYADTLLCLNTALMSDGLCIRVPARASLAKPVHIISLNTDAKPAGAVIRLLIVVEQGARAQFLESHGAIGPQAGMALFSSQFTVAAGGRLDHVKLQNDNLASTHLARTHIKLGSRAVFKGFTFARGGRLMRNQTHLEFLGEGASADLAGVFMISGTQHCDNTLFVDHLVPGCSSKQIFKGVIGGRARGVFQGRVTVHPDAQKTDGRQMVKALLLSQTAEFDAKPELKIYADEVQCAHGATAGEIDHELLFYLRARGIPETEAKSMLAVAFVGEAFGEIADEAVRSGFFDLAGKWLQNVGELNDG